jgi:hypothetical protein
MKKGFYTSWETKLPKIPTPKVGHKISLPTMFGEVLFKVVKVNDDVAELESETQGAYLRRKDGEWTFNNVTFKKGLFTGVVV